MHMHMHMRMYMHCVWRWIIGFVVESGTEVAPSHDLTAVTCTHV